MDIHAFPQAPPAGPDVTSVGTDPAAPHPSPPVDGTSTGSLASELRESLMLLGLAVGVTVGLTMAAQAAVSVLG